MKEVAVMLIGGIVAVALVTAFGLHAQGLANLSKSAGSATSGVLNTAEKG